MMMMMMMISMMMMIRMMTVYIIDYDDKVGDDSDDNFLFFSELETSDNDGRREVTNLMDMPLTMVRAYKHHYHHFECYHYYNRHPANHKNHHFICKTKNSIICRWRSVPTTRTLMSWTIGLHWVPDQRSGGTQLI